MPGGAFSFFFGPPFPPIRKRHVTSVRCTFDLSTVIFSCSDAFCTARRYDVVEPPAQVSELSLLYIEGLVLHSQLHPCLPSTGGVGKVIVTKVRGKGRGGEWRWDHEKISPYHSCAVEFLSFFQRVLQLSLWGLESRSLKVLLGNVQIFQWKTSNLFGI